MAENNLNLIFPQWQGAGPENTLFHPPFALAGRLQKLAFSTVPVPETADLSMENGILGYGQILDQMKAAGQLIERHTPETILTLGGDCGVQPMPVSFLNRRHRGQMSLVWLDAHADLNTPDTSPSGDFHGMPLASLMGLGDKTLCAACFSHVRPDQVIMAGLRNPDPEEVRFMAAENMTRIPVRDLESGPETLIRALRQKGNRPVYVHIDLDVLDPSTFPHVGWPETGGLMPDTLLTLLKTIKTEFQMAGLGLTEYTCATETDRALAILEALVRTFRT